MLCHSLLCSPGCSGMVSHTANQSHPGESRENIQDRDFGTKLCSANMALPTIWALAPHCGDQSRKGSKVFQRAQNILSFHLFFPKAAEWHGTGPMGKQEWER